MSDFAHIEKERVWRHDGTFRRDLRIVDVTQVPIHAGLAHSDVGEIRTRAHGAEEHWLVIKIVAADAAALSPAASNVGAEICRPHLLAVTVDTAIGAIHLTPEHSGPELGDRIIAAGFLNLLHAQAAVLQLRKESQPDPRRCERKE